MAMRKKGFEEGWRRYEGWAKRLIMHRNIKEWRLMLRSYDNVIGEQFFDEDDSDFPWATIQEDPRKVARRQVQFIKAYLVDVSSDQDDFLKLVNFTIACHNTRSWRDCYGLYFSQDFDNQESGASVYFQRFSANMFVQNYEDVDFSSVKEVLPFDNLIIRCAGREKWRKQTRKDVMDRIRRDLGFDGHDEPFELTSMKGEFLTLRWNRPV